MTMSNNRMSGSSSFNRFCCFCCCFCPSLVRDFNNNKNGTHTHNIEQLTRQANGGSKIIQIVFSTLLILPTDCHFVWVFIVAVAIANCIFVYFHAIPLASLELNHFNAAKANAYSKWQPFSIRL